jgi:UDP-N-acetylmuramoyl-L-alanyl-D-glutamate--2,6-diaminopimelate ligase
VFGAAGGGRDRSRRAVLGEFAGKRAHKVILTNEDPYDENPESIVDEIAAGVERGGKVFDKDAWKIMDRTEAIEKALAEAAPGDIVLITGKGSEQAMVVKGGKKLPWDDRTTVHELLKKLG